MNRDNAEIFLLNQEDVPNIVDVLCDSFANYPVMRFLLNSETNYDHLLKVLIHFFTMARIFRKEVIFGIGDRANLIGVALTSNPNNSMNVPELKKLRDKVWLELGPGPKARYEKFINTSAQFEVDQPHIHLNMIGVRTELQGKGFAGKLMNQVHSLSISDSNSKGITLTTEDPEKVSFYQYMGYNIIGEAMVTAQLKTWSFFRPN